MTLQYNTIQYHTIQCNAVPYNTVQYNFLQCTTIQYHTLPCHTIPYRTIQYNTVRYDTIQYDAIRSTIQQIYSTVRYSTIHSEMFLPFPGSDGIRKNKGICSKTISTLGFVLLRSTLLRRGGILSSMTSPIAVECCTRKQRMN